MSKTLLNTFYATVIVVEVFILIGMGWLEWASQYVPYSGPFLGGH